MSPGRVPFRSHERFLLTFAGAFAYGDLQAAGTRVVVGRSRDRGADSRGFGS